MLPDAGSIDDLELLRQVRGAPGQALRFMRPPW
jgi:hypothetical protein